MPTINEVLERVDRVRPNAVDDETKAGWLLALDGQIYRDVILRHALDTGVGGTGDLGACPKCGGGLVRERGRTACALCGWNEPPEYPQSFPEDGDVPLLVGPPDDRLYDLYLFAQIDALNRESENYNNSAALFNGALDEFKKMWHRTHRPLGQGRYRNVL